MLLTGLAFGGGMELAGAISRKHQASEASEGAQIINLSDYGPALAKFDSIESTNFSKFIFIICFEFAC